jgi:hypothetical protein
MRKLTVMVVMALMLASASASASSFAAGPSDAAESRIVVGSELVATADVAIRQATIAKGSRVRVTHAVIVDGRTVAVSLELKDGHVLHDVAISKVTTSFRIAR